MVKKNQPILVTGAHRSGTTWVGKMLAANPQVAYISEPLNILHRPGVMRVTTDHWYTYICRDNEHQYQEALQETLQFRYHTWLEIRALRSTRDVLRMLRDWNNFFSARMRRQNPLLKDPFAVFSAPWFADRLACRVVITVRHPAAFVGSLLRLNWTFDFHHLLDQPLLMRDWLEPYREEMGKLLERPEDIIASGSLLWEMIYQVVATYQDRYPEFIIVRHEDLSLDPTGDYQALYRQLDLEFTPKAKEVITRSTQAGNPVQRPANAIYSTKLDSQANLANWKRRLSAEQIERIHSLTAGVSDRYYQSADWE